ncbi:MAG: DNA polymerase III subunit delta [Patescibacteria group bacterium]
MIIFIYGQDGFRGRQKIKEFKDKYLREVDPTGSGLTRIDGQTTDMGEINKKTGASSLFAKKRLVVIDNIFLNSGANFLEKAGEYFKNKEAGQSDNIIIFFSPEIKEVKKKASSKIFLVDSQGREKPLSAKASKLFQFLSKQKYVQHYSLLTNRELVAWIKDNVRQDGVSISDKAVTALIGMAGSDLWRLQGEINKLVHYKKGFEKGGEDIKVEEEDVKDMVRADFDEDIFALTDALSLKDKKRAINLLEEQYGAGLSDAYLLSMTIRQFKILLRIREALDNGYTSNKIISQLKLHPFVAQKGINQVRNFKLEELKKIFSKLVEADYLMKTGKQDTRLMLDLLIVGL